MKKEAENKYSVFIKGFIIEALITAVGVLTFAVVMYFLEAGYEYSAVFATVSLAIGCFFGAFFAAKKLGQKGLLNGAIVGIITFATILVISLIVDKGAVTVNTLFHLIIFMLSSVIGGIVGVNKAHNKKYI